MLELIKSMMAKDKPEDEESLVALVNKKAKDAESWLESFHRQWFVNIAMRRGAQYVHAEAKGILVAPEVVDENRVRVIANKMQGIHSTRLAKLVKDLPKLECVPSSSSEEDKDLARRGTKLLDYVWQKERFVEKLTESLSWSIDTGNVFIMPRWDKDKGPKIPIYKRHEGQLTGQESYQVDEEGYILNDAGERIIEEITTGDVSLELVKPFDCVNDGYSDSLENSEWFIIQQAMPIKKIKEQWGDRAKDVKPEKDTKARGLYQKRLQALASNYGDYYAEPKDEGDQATVRFYFEKPCEEYPEGRYLVTCGSFLLETGPLQLADCFNLIHIGDIYVSGCFWKIGTMENIIPIQKGYNRTLSQIIENANNMGNIKIMAPKNSKLSSDAFDDSGDEVIEYDPTGAGEPHQLQPSELPGYVINLLNIYDKNFEDASGQHEVSHGKAPAGVKSGAALNALQEQDDTRLAPTKVMLLRSLERLGVMILKLYEKNMNVERKFQIIGETNLDVDEFVLKPEEVQSINKDVRVQTENLIASHKRLQQEQVMDLYGAGVLGDKLDPKVRKKVLQLLEFGNVADIFDDLNIDVSQARKENEQLVRGEGLEPLPDFMTIDPMTGQPAMVPSIRAYAFENQEVHLEIINSLRKSPLYRKLTPMQRRSVDMHAEQHENFLKPPMPAPIGAGPMATPPRGIPPLPIGKTEGVPPMRVPPAPPVNAGVIPPPPSRTPDLQGPNLMTGGR